MVTVLRGAGVRVCGCKPDHLLQLFHANYLRPSRVPRAACHASDERREMTKSLTYTHINISLYRLNMPGRLLSLLLFCFFDERAMSDAAIGDTDTTGRE